MTGSHSSLSSRLWASRRCACIGAAMMISLAGCHPPGKPDPDARAEAAAAEHDFVHLYRANCAGCHGADGKLGPALPLNDPIFLAIAPTEKVIAAISHGRPGTPMPAFARDAGGTLSDQDIQTLASCMKGQWQAATTPRADFPRYALHDHQQQSAGDAQAGAKVFARACADCHGTDGRGTSNRGPSNGIHEPAFLALISDQALRRVIITGRPDLGMPNYADGEGRSEDFQPLSEAEIDDLVALLASWRAEGMMRQAQSLQPTGSHQRD